MTEQVELKDLREDDADRTWRQDRPFTGQAVERYEDGVIASLTTYVDGYEEGLQKIWRRDGSLETEATLRRGNAVGKARSWHASGQLAEETMFDDKGHPRSRRRWDEAGNLLGEENWDRIYGSRE